MIDKIIEQAQRIWKEQGLALTGDMAACEDVLLLICTCPMDDPPDFWEYYGEATRN